MTRVWFELPSSAVQYLVGVCKCFIFSYVIYTTFYWNLQNWHIGKFMFLGHCTNYLMKIALLIIHTACLNAFGYNGQTACLLAM